MGKFKAQIVNGQGKAVTSPVDVRLNYSAPNLQKSAAALFGNIYGYGNAGKYRNRFYSLDDNSIGIDTYSRQLLVRWCRELTAQLPIIRAAITTLSDYAVGNSYLPEYVIAGKEERGKRITDWLVSKYYPRCCTRGVAFDFVKCKKLELETLYTDGDLVKIYGQDSMGFPMVQYIPTNRIQSSKDNYPITEGDYKGCIISDGVVYTKQGQAVAYIVSNSQNLVNTMLEQSSEVIFPVGKADLFFDADFFDKNRGLPKVGYSVLQAMSVQELDSYLMDKLKIESLVGLIEATPTGEAPQELQSTLNALIAGGTPAGNALQLSPQDHALEIKQGVDIRYVKANGGTITSLASNTPSDQMGNYMTRLEQQILSTMGVPHQILFSLQQAGGRITSAPANNFRKTIERTQGLLDKDARKEVAIAVAKALKNGLIIGKNGQPLDFDPEENLLEAFKFSHPDKFSLDQKYDNDIILSNLEAGVIPYNDACKQIANKTSEQVFKEQADDQIKFYTEAARVSKVTGRDIEKVIAEMRKSPLKVTSTMETPVEDGTNENT
jgi:hypothetical protein